jgi:hypothetical protein
MATRVTEPRYHCFTNIRKEAEAEAEDDDADMIELRQRGSSPIFSTYCFGKGEKLPLSLLDACRQSRQEFQKIFTLSQGIGWSMPCVS